jgi:hypothetical protein
MSNVFKKLLSEEENNIIAIDFDGVIHSFEFGYHDGTIYGTPIPGSRESLERLSQKFKLILYTAKAKPDRPLVNGKTGVELVQEWLEKYELDKYFVEITSEKPRCLCYIDDKAIQFTSWDNTLEELKKFTNEII